MSILQLPTPLVGQGGLKPATKKFVATDDLATITAPGYLNFTNLEGYPLDQGDILETLYNYNQITNSGTYGLFSVSVSNGVITLSGSGAAILPVVAGDFAVFSGTTGQIHDAGYAPSNASDVFVCMSPGSLTTNHIAQLADANGSIKDGGVLGTAANKAVSDNTKSTVASVSGSVSADNLAVYADSSGTLRASDGVTQISGVLGADSLNALTGTVNAATGFLSGFPTGGDAGNLVLYSPTSANGRLRLIATDAGGTNDTIISNTTMGQTTTYTIPNPLTSAANFAVASSALVNNNLVKANGTAGLVVDSGIATTNVQLKSSIKAATSGNVGGGGSTFVTVSVAECTTSSIVIPGISSSSVPVYVISIQALNGSFQLELSAIPGAVCFIDYIIFIAPQ